LLAVDALRQYDIAVQRLTLISHHLNILYRVDTSTGKRFALRISSPTWRSHLELQSELQWLIALDRETDIGAHTPLPNRSGELITTLAGHGVPESRRCVLFTWVPGVEVASRLTPENVEKMGELSARLHRHGQDFQPHNPFTKRSLDRLFPRDEEVVLFGAEHANLYSTAQRASFEHAWERAETELLRLYADPSGLLVVHGDLHHENIKVHRGKLRPIDFEDVIWAYSIQDIALTFYDFRYYTDPAAHNYEDLCHSFKRGYERLEPWPEDYPGQIDTLHVARQLWVANWVLINEDPVHHQPLIARLADRFGRFVDRN